MLHLAAAHGIDTLDTAIGYGESEACLGAIGTGGFKVVTKLPALPVDCRDVGEWVRGQLRSSLSRLGVGSVYAVLLHRPAELLGMLGGALYAALASLKETGQTEKIGISVYAPDELDALVPRYKFDLVQAPFNVVDRRLHTSGWMRRLKDLDVEIHTRSAFLQGLLLMPRQDIPSQFASWSSIWTTWHAWLEQHGVSAVEGSLAYPLSFAEIDRVLVGAESAAQLEEIITAALHAPADGPPEVQSDDENLLNPARWSR